MKRIYIHGLGQTASSWNPVLDALPVTSDQNICLDLSAIIKKQQINYSNLYAAFSDCCDTQTEEIVLCGDNGPVGISASSSLPLWLETDAVEVCGILFQNVLYLMPLL